MRCQEGISVPYLYPIAIGSTSHVTFILLLVCDKQVRNYTNDIEPWWETKVGNDK